MNPGRLSRKIIIQSKTVSQDAELNAIETWATYKTVWAEPIPKEGREFYRLSVRNADMDEAFRIRYTSGITVNMRVSFKDLSFDIISIVNSGEDNKELVLSCKAVV